MKEWPAREFRRRPGGLAASLAGLALLLVAGCGGSPPQAPAAGTAEHPSSPQAAGRGRLVIIGIDGADWQVIQPLVDQGRLPAFARLIREGATGVLRSMEPSASPSLWTTMATGVGPDRHGIHGFIVGAEGEGEAPRNRSQIRPVTSSMRKAPAFWNILPQYGLKVGIVGWLVTWPAEPVDGYIVSSYLPYIYNWSTGRPLKGTIISGIPHQTFPEGLIASLDPFKVKPADLDASTVARFYDPARVARLPSGDRECVEGFLWSLACDETYRRIGLHLFETYPVDVFAVYFGGVDVSSHRFWKFTNPRALRYKVTSEEAAALGRVIPEYYAYVDGIVGEYLARLRDVDTLVVLSDHGFKPVLFPGRPNTSGHHRMEGILAIWGRGARRGGRLTAEPGLVDILPTLCVLAGTPIAMDLEGHVIEEALDPRFAVDHPPRFVETYAAASTPPGPEQSDVDRNVLERLRSLGYIN